MNILCSLFDYVCMPLMVLFFRLHLMMMRFWCLFVFVCMSLIIWLFGLLLIGFSVYVPYCSHVFDCSIVDYFWWWLFLIVCLHVFDYSNGWLRLIMIMCVLFDFVCMFVFFKTYNDDGGLFFDFVCMSWIVRNVVFAGWCWFFVFCVLLFVRFWLLRLCITFVDDYLFLFDVVCTSMVVSCLITFTIMIRFLNFCARLSLSPWCFFDGGGYLFFDRCCLHT